MTKTVPRIALALFLIALVALILIFLLPNTAFASGDAQTDPPPDFVSHE